MNIREPDQISENQLLPVFINLNKSFKIRTNFSKGGQIWKNCWVILKPCELISTFLGGSACTPGPIIDNDN